MNILFVSAKVMSLCTVVVLSLLLFSCASTNPDIARIKNPTVYSQQIVVVQTADWDSLTGILQYYERDKPGDPWKKAGEETEVNVGRTGLAWGSGLHGTKLGNGPTKHEGDGKAPAGIFRLRTIFGYAPRDSVRFLKMRYIVADSTCQCIDDVNSEYYNLVIDSLSVAKADWKSHERMKISDSEYKWGVVVDHNVEPRIAGNGSCIFLHIWAGPSRPTEGCTSFREDYMSGLIRWLDESKNPLLVQFPGSEYNRLRVSWKLP